MNNHAHRTQTHTRPTRAHIHKRVVTRATHHLINAREASGKHAHAHERAIRHERAHGGGGNSDGTASVSRASACGLNNALLSLYTYEYGQHVCMYNKYIYFYLFFFLCILRALYTTVCMSLCVRVQANTRGTSYLRAPAVAPHSKRTHALACACVP